MSPQEYEGFSRNPAIARERLTAFTPEEAKRYIRSLHDNKTADLDSDMIDLLSESTFDKVFTRLQQVAEMREESGKGPITVIGRASLERYTSLQGFSFVKYLLPRNVRYGTPNIVVYRSGGAQ